MLDRSIQINVNEVISLLPYHREGILAADHCSNTIQRDAPLLLQLYLLMNGAKRLCCGRRPAALMTIMVITKMLLVFCCDEETGDFAAVIEFNYHDIEV